ncbi:MAG: FkbM family methyltransferase [Planctomycetota bacterium]
MGDRLRTLLNAGLVGAQRLKRATLGERLRLADHPRALAAYRLAVGWGRARSVEVHGHRLRLDPLDSLHLSLRGRYEEGETAFVQRQVGPGDLVFDVGAHVGYFSLLFARAVGPRGHVLAFEPHPHNRALLLENVAANGYRNVAVLPQAVADGAGQATLYASAENTGDNALHGSGSGFPVETLALDRFEALARGRRVFLKLDTQGHEPQVFAGARGLLQAAQELTALFEFWPHGLRAAGADPRALLALGAELGCAAHTLSEAGELEPLDPDALLTELAGEAFTTVVWTR